MKWYEIIVNTNSEGTELVADAFFTIGCLGGVKIIDKNDILDIVKNDKMWDYIDDDLLKECSVVKVSGFVSESELDTKLAELKECLDFRKVLHNEITVAEFDDEAWYESWKRFYSPIDADRYVVVPKWINYDNKDNKTMILIDPGMAFGTGEHESTKLCLKLMSEEDFSNKNVIDVGTGSGILGIGAIKSNAKSCYMCDIDSIAVQAANENSKLNKVENSVTIELADLLTKNTGKADIMLANLTADILIRLSKGLTNYIEKDGILICSGIINLYKDEVVEVFNKNGFTLISELVMGEWYGLKFRY
jgi:ribosomal protein L11 methyltransferase